jgi:hypothetical protein
MTERAARKAKREGSASSDYDSESEKKNARRRKKYRTRASVKYESPIQRPNHPTGTPVAHVGSSSMNVTESPRESFPNRVPIQSAMAPDRLSEHTDAGYYFASL